MKYWRDWLKSVWRYNKERTKPNSILYHGPVWITLNSFIWNIKTMKHKPSTKSDSYKCRIIRLLKMNRLYWKTTVFFSLNGEADTQNRQWDVNMIMPFTRSKSYLTARRKIKEERKEKARKKKKSRRKWNSDIRPTTAWSACGSGCGPGI